MLPYSNQTRRRPTLLQIVRTTGRRGHADGKVNVEILRYVLQTTGRLNSPTWRILP